jgi:hypothetical protein
MEKSSFGHYANPNRQQFQFHQRQDSGTDVLPELLEIFSQQVRPHRPQIVFQQLFQFHGLPVRQVLPSLEQTPA